MIDFGAGLFRHGTLTATMRAAPKGQADLAIGPGARCKKALAVSGAEASGVGMPDTYHRDATVERVAYIIPGYRRYLTRDDRPLSKNLWPFSGALGWEVLSLRRPKTLLTKGSRIVMPLPLLTTWRADRRVLSDGLPPFSTALR
ncbi:MAG: hypothetical protein AAGF76_09400 [Pseudomonadota bacterium]